MKKFAVILLVIAAVCSFISNVAYVPCRVIDVKLCDYLVAENDQEIIIVTHGSRDGRIIRLDNGERERQAQEYFKQVAADYGCADKEIRYFSCFTVKQQKGEAKPVISHNDVGFVVPTPNGVFFFTTRKEEYRKNIVRVVMSTVTNQFGLDSKEAKLVGRLFARS